MYKTLHASRVSEQVAEQIERSVLSGSLKPGDQLPPERELAKRFGVSRSALREAARALQQKGLLAAHQGRGTFITNATPKAARQSVDLMLRIGGTRDPIHLIEAREMIEPEIAARAATRVRAGHLLSLHRAVAAMDASLNDPGSFLDAELDFHRLLAQAADNSVVPILVDSILGLRRRSAKETTPAGRRPVRPRGYHRRILAALERHDPAAARKAMRAHLKQVRADVQAAAAVERQSAKTQAG